VLGPWDGAGFGTMDGTKTRVWSTLVKPDSIIVIMELGAK
jgi:hypothetical protein